MTIGEKAKETIPDAFDNDEILPVREGFIVNQQRFAFHHGANWMLEKAMTLIEDSVIFDKFGRPVKPETIRTVMEQ